MTDAIEQAGKSTISGEGKPDVVACTPDEQAGLPEDLAHEIKGKRSSSRSTLVPSLLIAVVACVVFLGLFHIVSDNDDLHVIPKKNFTFCLTFSSLNNITSDYRNKPDLNAFHNDEHLDHLVREMVRRGVIKVR